ncbi:protein kinase [Streptomyces sp. NPDC056975]|uniref:WD40 repeat domain-containing serine/threonine protein kinase n=1 Tax=Streptomyces sp. NPDC056975 TaxID=3345985 RepID=UPI0036419B35
MTGTSGEQVGGRYRLVEVLGRGGMGRVWRAEDEVLGRRVAVKQVLLSPELSAEERSRLIRRTQVEAEATARLRHSGVVTVHDVIDHEGAPWIVMELLPGPSLATLIAEQGRLDWKRVAALGAQVADALAHAHTAGVVHRDIKPDNILMDGDRAVLTDFGIARILDSVSTLTSTQAVIGTPQYMPPEQLNGQKATASGDLWALGATLYAAVEGRPPYTGDSLMALVASVLTSPLPSPRHAGDLTGILTELLVREAGLRPTAADTGQRLRALYPAPQAPSPHTGPETGVAFEAAPTQTATVDDRTATPEPPPKEQRPDHPETSINTPQPPSERRTLTRRSLLSGAVTTTALAGGLVAWLTRDQPGDRATGSVPTNPRTLEVPDSTADDVKSVVFSPDSKTLAGATQGATPVLWDVATGKPKPRVAPALEAPFLSWVAFSPDGKLLATASSDNRAGLWDVVTGKLTVNLTGHTDMVYSVTFSPDGKGLATGSADRTVMLWDVATARTTATFAHPDGVTSVVFSPAGKLLATASNDGSTRLWHLATGKSTTVDTSHTGRTDGIGSVVFSPDGKTLATANGVDSTVRLWDVANGKASTTFAHPAGVDSLAFSPDGRLLATSCVNGSIRLWSLATRKTAAVIPSKTDGTAAVAISPDGKLLATGTLAAAGLWSLRAPAH